ncbi:hypothetical protein RUM43_001901 [Polyplax serrata]|uniref:Uncharacterized protein n=1 Tax=Polyplax serrata TaxID=468196 RepID=A0AAN8SGW5_POLSC
MDIHTDTGSMYRLEDDDDDDGDDDGQNRGDGRDRERSLIPPGFFLPTWSTGNPSIDGCLNILTGEPFLQISLASGKSYVSWIRLGRNPKPKNQRRLRCTGLARRRPK